jgi:protein O-GlcNAc transferase
MTDPFIVEKLWRLPTCAWCYQPTEDMPDIQPRPGGPIVFGSFNNFSKVSTVIMEVWAKVLANNAGSSLLILLPSSECVRPVWKTFANAGIDTDRIEVLGRVDRAGYLRMFNRVDVSLDPYPYHGTVTTCESLWMGVPVVSLAGRTHVSRVGVSLLSNAGLGELVAESPERYVRIATELAQDADRLSQMRLTMREKMRQSPLMDAKRYAGDIGNAFRQMWRAWCAGDTK